MRKLWSVRMARTAFAVGLAASVIVGGSGCSKRADIAGTWEGSIDISSITAKMGKGPASLKLVYKIQKGSGDAYTGTLTSPDQSPQAINLDTATLKDGSVSLGANMISAKFDGKLSGDGKEITGTFVQGANSFPLTLKQTAGASG